MKFPNAYNGVKKIYTAEILYLIGIIFSVIAVIAAFVAAGAIEIGEDAISAGSVGTMAVFGLIAGVLLIVGFIIYLVGLNNGKKDEPLFKTALMFVLAAIVITLIGSFTKGTVSKLFSDLSSVASILITYYVIRAIISLADKLNNAEVAQKGKRVINLIFTVFILSFVASILGHFALTGTASAIISIVATILSLIQCFIYLSFLSRAKRMLAQ